MSTMGKACLAYRELKPEIGAVLQAEKGAGCGIVGDAAGADVEGAGLDGGNTFVHQLRAAIHQPGFFGTVFQRLARNLVVVGLVGLAEVGGIGEDAGALLLHPQ